MRRGGGARALVRRGTRGNLRSSSKKMDAHADASTSTTPEAMPPAAGATPPAPRRRAMIDVTDRHFRMLIRCVSPLPTLWTEMTWDRAILYNAH